MANHLEKVKKLKEQQKQNPFVRAGAEFKEHEIHTELSKEVPEKLIDIEKEINKLKERTYEVAWLIGKRLISIRDNHLKETDFEYFEDYIEDKFDFSKMTAYNFIFVAENFSRVKASLHGYKLVLLRKLDKSHHQKYIEWIENENPSARKVEEKIKLESQKIGRPQKEINLSKTRVTINLKKMDAVIPKERSTEFLKRLETLVREFSK